MTAFAAASYLMRLSAPDTEKSLSHLGLHLMLYYAQGWRLCVHGAPLFDELMEAWPAGPITPTVWEKLGARDHLALDPKLGDVDAANSLAPPDRAILDLVFDAYAGVPVWTLRQLAQAEPPWSEARAGQAATDAARPKIPLTALEAFFTDLRDLLLDQAELGALEDSDDLSWLAAAMRKHGEP